jgi:hypothetical protein
LLVKPKAVEAALGLLSKEFGKEATLTVCQEKAHNYIQPSQQEHDTARG